MPLPPPPPSSLARQLVRADAAPVTVASAYSMQRVELRLSDDPALAARVIRLLPPLVIQEAEAKTLVAILAPLVKAFLAETPAAAAA